MAHSLHLHTWLKGIYMEVAPNKLGVVGQIGGVSVCP